MVPEIPPGFRLAQGRLAGGSGASVDSAEKQSLVVTLNPSFPQDKLREGSQVTNRFESAHSLALEFYDKQAELALGS